MRSTPLPKSQTDLLAKSIESAEFRRSDFIKAVPPELSKREDEIEKRLASENSSTRSKLRKIYHLMDELGQIRAPYVACGKGCSSCCKMNVKISQIEANIIAERTGMQSKQLPSSRSYKSDQFMGVPCVFLKEGSCSIYEIRPFVCRNHVSFDTTSYWCEPENSLHAEMPMLAFSGLLDAYFNITKKDSGGVHADIRDFFS